MRQNTHKTLADVFTEADLNTDDNDDGGNNNKYGNNE